MGDIALINNDVASSQFGDISLVVSDSDDILQQARNNIMTIYGELYNHPDIGNNVFNGRYKIKDDMGDIETCCENAILCDSRVDSVDEILVTKSDIVGNIAIVFKIVTASGSTLSSSCNISIT